MAEKPLEIIVRCIDVPYERLYRMGFGEEWVRTTPVEIEAVVLMPNETSNEIAFTMTKDEETAFAELMRRVCMRYMAETRDAFAQSLERAGV